ncbi:hypothetical protein THTE_4187 [Thermogutta terrifontis]|uniref:Uncharacterized protein n=1 Tax=Thermogutta terrifontis TaxID=1331910 RepID=A0A286RLF0_9BACT|nr:hypothetical protein THTE_4187 [Thermogutta terrifontis]
MSRPLINLQYSLGLWRGLKATSKAGLKPRTPWSTAIHRRFFVKASAFTTLPFALICRDHENGSRATAIYNGPQRHLLPAAWRGFL